MKYFSKLIFATAILFSTLSASAQSTNEPYFKAVKAHPELSFPSSLLGHPTPDLSALSKAVPASMSLASGPATALSNVLVYAVESSSYGGWEYMTTAGQASTVGYHSGPILRVAVVAFGYGNTPVVFMGGRLLPTSAFYQSTFICVVNGAYSFSCPAGYTAVGFVQYFDIDGYSTPGEFTYQSTSLNPPINTLSTQIQIK